MFLHPEPEFDRREAMRAVMDTLQCCGDDEQDVPEVICELGLQNFLAPCGFMMTFLPENWSLKYQSTMVVEILKCSHKQHCRLSSFSLLLYSLPGSLLHRINQEPSHVPVNID